MRPTSGIHLAVASLGVILALSSCAATEYSSGGSRTYFGFTLGVESAPPPPPPVAFAREPRYEPVEESEVLVVQAPDPNCDMFRYHGMYYIFYSGYWYRGDNYGGPYRLIEVGHVPRPVLIVPEDHWHHRPHWDRGNHGDHGHGHDNGDEDRN